MNSGPFFAIPYPCKVSQLPVAPTATEFLGIRWMVNDATVAPAGNYGSTVVGGGAHLVPIVNVGASWIVG